jgi:hypothetical protein
MVGMTERQARVDGVKTGDFRFALMTVTIPVVLTAAV